MTHENALLELQEINTHNLKNISIAIPLGSLTAVSGVSGSGKSSLVFHTLHAHSYRRYVDSLSSYARQFLKSFPKPDVNTTLNLLPSIAVRQSGGGLGPRSTVGSLTEIHHLLRTIFATEASCHCPHGHGECAWFDEASMTQHIIDSQPKKNPLLICAPLSSLLQVFEGPKVQPQKKQTTNPVLSAVLAMLEEQGLVRFKDPKGGIHKLSSIKEQKELSPQDLREWSIVMDRINLSSEGAEERLLEAIKKSLSFSQDQVEVVDTADHKSTSYRLGFHCLTCGYHAPKPQSEFFQATHPKGACESCQGYGRVMIWNWDKILSKSQESPHPSLSNSLDVCKGPGGKAFYESLRESCQQRNIPLTKPFLEYSEEDLRWIKWGQGPQLDNVESKDDDLPSRPKGFYGFRGFLTEQLQKSSQNTRFHLARYRSYKICDRCHGQKLRPLSLTYQLQDLNFPQVQNLTISHLITWLGKVEKHGAHRGALREVFREGYERLSYLEEIGLSYLSMGREARSLSGGELQRIHMARCLGSALTRTLYCLDEPTAGLHPLDTQRLLGVMKKLRDQGNTVVVVEHDPQTLKGCDHLLRIGPGAGHEGGQLCYTGTPAKCPDLKKNPKLWKQAKKASSSQAIYGHKFITLTKVHTHNLNIPKVKFPLGAITGVCGVSGSGKTSLIRHNLYPALCEKLSLAQKHDTPASDYKSLDGEMDHLSNVLLVSQEALGKSSRANIATYLGIFTEIRNILASTSEAKGSRFTASTFSFNSPGGRCETCLGLGTVTEDLSFLGEIAVTCPSCKGKRFLPEVLKVKYRDKNIHQILSLTVSEARSFFDGEEAITRVLDEVLDLGLGYLTLAQSTRSFSGGEAQRLKILRLLIHKDHNRKGAHVLIFDEPTGGLAEEDVLFLWRKFQKLKEAGHTLVVVEHHLGLLQSVDWLIEIGPGSAHKGGTLVFQGPPEEILKNSQSTLAPFLKES